VLDLEQLAELLASKLDERQAARQRWVDAGAVSVHLGVERSYVYEHADELRAARLGDGPRARLRFRLELVDEAVASGTVCPPGRRSEIAASGAVEPKPRRRRARRSGTCVELLPVRGSETA
jgi:hypothetical protein